MNNSAFVHESPGASVKLHIDVKSDDFRNFIANLREATASANLQATDADQIDADLNTVEAQIVAPRPNTTVVHSCLMSVKAILEGTTGSLLASGIIAGIQDVISRIS